MGLGFQAPDESKQKSSGSINLIFSGSDWPSGLPGDSRWAGGLVGRWAGGPVGQWPAKIL